MQIQVTKGPSGRIVGLRNLLDGLTRDDILKVFPGFSLDLAAHYGFKDSTDYDLVHDGKRYPPKAILGLAAERVVGRPLSADEFAGGEKSAAFTILGRHKFDITPKSSSNSVPLDVSVALTRYQRYTREEIARIFAPNYKFTPGAGSWGISGIVESPKASRNFVFIVTLGKPHPGNPYQDALTKDGFLIWESQTQHTLESEVIKKLITHDHQVNNIHLFVRSSGSTNYVFVGLLEYWSHDEGTSNPVHFVWKVRSWDLTKSDFSRLELDVRDAIDPAYSPVLSIPALSSLVEVAPPLLGQSKRGNGEKKGPINDNIDWAARDERNRHLGLAGEKLIFEYEIETLKRANRDDLAQQVKHIALYDSTAGYDILSFCRDGMPKRIEVKTTQGPLHTAFYISINEVLASRENPENYWVYRVYGFDKKGSEAKFFKLHGDVEKCCELKPVSFRARPSS